MPPLTCSESQGDGASAAPTNVEFEDFDDYASYAASRMRNQADAQNAEATDGTTPKIPLDDVCEAVQVGVVVGILVVGYKPHIHE